MADVQIIGDEIFYDRIKVAVLLPGLETTPRGEFCDLIANGLDEQNLADKINEAECEAEADGKRSVISELRIWVRKIDGDDPGDTLAALLDQLDELEGQI